MQNLHYRIFGVLAALLFVSPLLQANNESTPSLNMPQVLEKASALYSVDFGEVAYGQVPDGWHDLVNYRPNRNWVVDSKGFLRVILKEYVGAPADGDRLRRKTYLANYGMKHFHGIIAYEGPLQGDVSAGHLADVGVRAAFSKTPDVNVSFALLARIKDRDNYYAARVVESGELRIVRVLKNEETLLTSIKPARRLSEKDLWTLGFSVKGDFLEATITDADGGLIAYLHTKDDALKEGSTGISATTFAAARDFWILSATAAAGKRKAAEQIAGNQGGYSSPMVKAVSNPESLDTPFDAVASDYDVIVAGGGTGGLGAALQAARLGARVLLLEETDYIGGQMANAGVTSMDDGGIYGKNPSRERGLYKEFHESAAAHYYAINKDPFTAYRFNLQSEGGYEPRVARAILYGMIQETRDRAFEGGKKGVLDLLVRSRVTAVQKDGDRVVGATVEEWTPDGPREKRISCRVLIDATEYGDVTPLTGARYRVGTSTSDNIDMSSPMQDHTWLAIMQEYPEGIPEHLKIKEAPESYSFITRRFANYKLYGHYVWGGATKGIKPRSWIIYMIWRGMPDSSSDATGEMTENRQTRSGFNGGNDYKVTAGTAENYQQRLKDEANGIDLTLGIIYWLQQEMGRPWAPAMDENYATPYNIARMKERGIREDLIPIAAMLPQLPYAREGRRIIGVETLRGQDIYLRDRDEERARHWASTVSINDYSFDLHGTEDSIEKDLDERNYINATGPFPIPFGVFIPEKIDGFVPAEKNISQSRLVNGATRLQASTMQNGQAAGVIAALSALKGVQPRNLNIIDVQRALLENGQTLQSRWYEDVEYGSPLWQATQLLSLYGILDRDGSMLRKEPMGETKLWDAAKKPSSGEINKSLDQLKKLIPDQKLIPSAKQLAKDYPTRAELALALADLIRQHGQYRVSDPEPYKDPEYNDRLQAARKKKAAQAGKIPKKNLRQKEEAQNAKTEEKQTPQAQPSQKKEISPEQAAKREAKRAARQTEKNK